MDFFSTPETMPVYKQPGWESSQLGDIPFLGLTLAFSTLVFIVEIVLDLRQYEKFSVALLKKKVPKELVGIIKQETFDKANDCKLFGSASEMITEMIVSWSINMPVFFCCII